MPITYSRVADPIGSIGAFESRLVFGDFDGDGDIDVLYQNGNTAGQGFGYRVNNGNGTFSDVGIGSSPFRNVNFTGFQLSPSAVFAIDYDHDGDIDLVDRTNNATGVFQNSGGLFTRLGTDPIGDTGTFDARLVFGDFDGDGDIDVFYQNTNVAGQGFGYRVNNGNGTFNDVGIANSPFRNVDLSNYQLSPSALFAIDYDNDGDIDLVDRTTNATGVFQNNGGVLTRLATDPIGDTGTFDSRLVFGDFDSDGDIDVFYQNTNVAGQGFGYRINNGNGTFSDIGIAASPFAGIDFTNFQLSPTAILALDIDNDGDVDLVDRTNGATSLLRQNGAPPRLTGATPADNSGNVATSANIVLTFSEAVVARSGTIQIVRTSDNTVVETIAAGSSRVVVNGTTVVIDPATTLAPGTGYAVRITPGAFADTDGAIYRGIADNTTLNFTTAQPQEPIVNVSSGNAAFVEGSNVTSTPVVVDPGVTVIDPDSPTFLRATVRITAGLQPGQDVLGFTAGAAYGNITGSYDTATGTLTLTSAGGTATQAQFQAALRSVTFTNLSDAPSTANRTLAFSVSDTTGTGFSIGRTLTVTAVNDSPGLGGPATVVFYNEDQTPALVAPAIQVADPDSANLVGATATIRNREAGDQLNFVNQNGITGSFDATSGVLVLSGSATVAQYQAALRSITFSTSSDTPVAGIRNIGFVVNDGGAINPNSAQAVAQVQVYPTDDAPVAVADAAATGENATRVIRVLDNDTDVDGGPKNVVQIGQVTATVGTPVTLPSGARVTLNADGTLTYDPNHAFDYLVSAASATATGAVDTQATDIFRYSLNGGSATNVTVTISGVDNAGDQLRGDGGDNLIVGTPQNDFFNLSQGGDDTARGNAGNDGFYMGAEYTTADAIDGGAGTLDQLAVQGRYAQGFTLGGNVTGIEQVVLLSGADTRFGEPGTNRYDYFINTTDDLVAAGQRLVVTGNTLRAEEQFSFDGRAETNGNFLVYGGLGLDRFVGGQQDDGFFFGDGRFNGDDAVDGQGGNLDQLGLQGNYAGANAIVFQYFQLISIENLVLLTGSTLANGGRSFSYDITLNDANVEAGHAFAVSANGLIAGETLTLNASAESDAAIMVFSGAGDDVLRLGALGDTVFGGAGADRITGGGGADRLTGGAGNDTFVYTAVSDSTLAAQDHILDFTSGDHIDLAAIDANSTAAGAQRFTFIGNGAFTGAGQLRAVNTTGNDWLVEGDLNGDGVADLSILVTTTDGHALGQADFTGLSAPAVQRPLAVAVDAAGGAVAHGDTSAMVWRTEALPALVAKPDWHLAADSGWDHADTAQHLDALVSHDFAF